jgi:hypothetical protein
MGEGEGEEGEGEGIELRGGEKATGRVSACFIGQVVARRSEGASRLCGGPAVAWRRMNLPET